MIINNFLVHYNNKENHYIAKSLSNDQISATGNDIEEAIRELKKKLCKNCTNEKKVLDK